MTRPNFLKRRPIRLQSLVTYLSLFLLSMAAWYLVVLLIGNIADAIMLYRLRS